MAEEIHPGDQQLDECLTLAEQAAGLAFDRGVRQAVFDERRETFRRNAAKYPSKAESVRKAARFVGRFARVYADFDGASKIRVRDMQRAKDHVAELCDAQRAHGDDAGVLHDWCN